MKTIKSPDRWQWIFIGLISFFIAFFSPSICHAQEQGEKYTEVSSFDTFTSSLDKMQSSGGTIVLTEDITVPAGASYTYNNGRYRKEVIIETNGHTVYVEGYLDLWPFLSIYGNDSQRGLFHVSPGGELRLSSICLDAGENGIAITQEEGAFLTYGTIEGSGLPEFSCTGQIISPPAKTAAAYWAYDCEKLPVVRVPDGAEFSADMLPGQVLSLVNRDHSEYEEEVPVIWDDTTFPTEQKRTLVRGRFTDGYSQYKTYAPQCLVVWESDTSPFFLNVYMESTAQWFDMVYMYGESPQSGTIYVQASADGENWSDITGTEGYSPIKAEQGEKFSWILIYMRSELAEEHPAYYRLFQIFDDGTEFYSDALELSDSLIFTAADIEGGRGGETHPDEGEDQLSGDVSEAEENDKASPQELPDQESEKDSTGSGKASSSGNAAASGQFQKNKVTFKSVAGNNAKDAAAATAENTTEAAAENVIQESLALQPSESSQTADESPLKTEAEKIIGMAILLMILAGSVVFSVFMRKKQP